MRSDNIRVGLDRAGHRSLLKALGVTDEEMKMIQEELKKLAEEFQTSEMVNLYAKEITPKQMRWLE